MPSTILKVFGLFLGLSASMYAEDWKTLSDKAEAAMVGSRFDEAIGLYTRALKLKPDHPSLLANRGNCYSYKKDLKQALRDYDKSIASAKKMTGGKEDKRFTYLYYNKAYAYDLRDMHKEAIPLYKRVIKLDKKYPDVKGHLAWILATTPKNELRDAALALKLCKMECEATKWKDSGVIDTLAACYAGTGDFQLAIKWQTKAIDLAKEDAAKEEFRERLELYRKKKIYTQN